MSRDRHAANGLLLLQAAAAARKWEEAEAEAGAEAEASLKFNSIGPDWVTANLRG